MTQRCMFPAVEEAWNKRFVFSFYGFLPIRGKRTSGPSVPPPTMGSPTIEEGFYFHTTEIENKNRALRVVWVG